MRSRSVLTSDRRARALMASILRSVLSISVATVLSRATGYLRWMAQAAVLAGGLVADAYTASILLPSLIYELFMGGILYSIFIPVLVDRITTHGEEDARRLTNALFTLVLPLMLVLSLVGIVFAEPLVGLVTNWQSADNLSPAEVGEVQGLAVFFFRIFVLQMFFYGISTVGTGVLQAHRRFFLPTFAPVLNNLMVIASFVAYYFLRENDQRLALYVLAFGVTAGVAVMALALVPTMLELGYRPRPQFGHPALLPTARLAGPMVVLVAASVGFQFFGAYLAMGFEAVAELTYAFTIFSLPYGVFVVAITTALMPELSEKYSLRDADGYRDTFSFGLRTMAFVVVPSAVGMISLSKPIVGVLYEHLNFGATGDRVGLRAARGLRGGAARLLGVLLPGARLLLAAEHEDPRRVERRHLPAVRGPRLRALPRLGHHRRGARAGCGLLGARHPEPRGDAQGNGPAGRPAPRQLPSQGARLPGRPCTPWPAIGTLLLGTGLGLHGAPPRPRRRRRRSRSPSTSGWRSFWGRRS